MSTSFYAEQQVETLVNVYNFKSQDLPAVHVLDCMANWSTSQVSVVSDTNCADKGRSFCLVAVGQETAADSAKDEEFGQLRSLIACGLLFRQLAIALQLSVPY